jgi:hypothetical protein
MRPAQRLPFFLPRFRVFSMHCRASSAPASMISIPLAFKASLIRRWILNAPRAISTSIVALSRWPSICASLKRATKWRRGSKGPVLVPKWEPKT